MLGLKFKIDGVYFTTFRKPLSTSLILSYSVPPYTTIRGLVSNALGLKRDDYSVQDWMEIGVKPLIYSNKSTELAKILKLKDTGHRYEKKFPSSPVFKEFLVLPSYEIYAVGENDKITTIYKALKQPVRPLYMGASDELIDIELSEPLEVKKHNATEVSGMVGGIQGTCLVERLPYKFIKKGKEFSLEYKTVSIPQHGTISLNKEISCWRFDGENVWLT